MVVYMLVRCCTLMHRLLAPDERVGGTARPPVGLVCLWHLAAVVVACPRCHVESDVRCVAVFLSLKTLPHSALYHLFSSNPT